MLADLKGIDGNPIVGFDLLAWQVLERAERAGSE
jgi:hypothetical protein